jgi:hypothetical protein
MKSCTGKLKALVVESSPNRRFRICSTVADSIASLSGCYSRPNAIRANDSSREAYDRLEGGGSFANITILPRPWRLCACPDVGSREGTGFRSVCQQAVSVLETTGLLIQFLLDRASLSRLRIKTVPLMTEDSLRQGDDYFRPRDSVKTTSCAIRHKEHMSLGAKSLN